MEKTPLCVYDGECHFCRMWAMNWKNITGERVSYAPFQEVARNFEKIKQEEFEKSVKLILPNGQVLSGAHAVFSTLAFNPSWRWLLWLYEHFFGFAPISELVYTLVAAHRHLFSYFAKLRFKSRSLMEPFRLLPHAVTSDVAFEAFGKTEAELFGNAARATFSVMCDVKTVEPKEKRAITLKANTLEDLLFNFLNELIFLKDRDGMLFSEFKVDIDYDTRKYHSNGVVLTSQILGEKIDPEKHNLGVDVKAVTKHNFSVKQESGIVKATVVLDI